MATTKTVFKRNECKYLLSAKQAKQLLAAMDRHVVEDEYGKYSICSLYFDSADNRALGNGRKQDYKEKLRLRSYGLPSANSTVFLELKKKVDGVTYKRRVPLTLTEAESYLQHGLTPQHSGQVFEEINWFHKNMAPERKLVLCYDRIAFAGVEDPSLRLTFDTNVRWRGNALSLAKGDWGSQLLAPGQVLLEIKVEGAYPVWLSRALSQLEIYPTSFSKYRVASEQKNYEEATRCAG